MSSADVPTPTFALRFLAHPAGVFLATLPFALLAVTGMFRLVVFDGTPGPQHPAPLLWPAGSAIQRSTTDNTVVIFAHPSCACTRSTLYELSRVIDTQNRAVLATRTVVLFVRPAHDTTWQPGDIWDQVSSIPRAHAQWDEDGVEARRFHAGTSGIVLLYDIHGRLLFEGGITGARGHAGDNYGSEHLRSALESGISAQSATPVFGCSLAIPRPPGKEPR